MRDAIWIRLFRSKNIRKPEGSQLPRGDNITVKMPLRVTTAFAGWLDSKRQWPVVFRRQTCQLMPFWTCRLDNRSYPTIRFLHTSVSPFVFGTLCDSGIHSRRLLWKNIAAASAAFINGTAGYYNTTAAGFSRRRAAQAVAPLISR